MRQHYDFGSWLTYVFARLGGVELAEYGMREASLQRRAAGRRDQACSVRRAPRPAPFGEAYGDTRAGVAMPEGEMFKRTPVIRGPVTYTGHEALARDIADMKAALEAAGLKDGFLNSVGPASCGRLPDEHYDSEEEALYAFADAMREEYKAIVDAGLILQIDDPVIADNWDQIVPSRPSRPADSRRPRIEALNHAIRGLPPERIRFHLCWGSWHGPHSTDIPMADIVE